MKNYITDYIKGSIEVKTKVLNDPVILNCLEEFANRAVIALKNGNKIITAGNGGSAADAQHIAAELVSRFYFDRPPLEAVSLTTNSSIITAIGNDYGYETLFSRQLEAIGKKNDIFIAISTSGNSPNILKALEVARKIGLLTLGLTGKSGGKMASLCDFIIRVPSDNTPLIQESHIMVGHLLCALIEREIFGKKN